VPDWLLCGDAKAHNVSQVDVSEDGFLSLMSDDGSTKDDVKVPDGEVGDKINKLFTEDGKDTSTSKSILKNLELLLTRNQASLFSPPWARRPLLTPRRLPNK
jgi:hypothetical protein